MWAWTRSPEWCASLLNGLFLGGNFILNSVLKSVSLQVNLSMLGSGELELFTFNWLFIQPQKEAPSMFAQDKRLCWMNTGNFFDLTKFTICVPLGSKNKLWASKI